MIQFIANYVIEYTKAEASLQQWRVGLKCFISQFLLQSVLIKTETKFK